VHIEYEVLHDGLVHLAVILGPAHQTHDAVLALFEGGPNDVLAVPEFAFENKQSLCQGNCLKQHIAAARNDRQSSVIAEVIDSEGDVGREVHLV